MANPYEFLAMLPPEDREKYLAANKSFQGESSIPELSPEGKLGAYLAQQAVDANKQEGAARQAQAALTGQSPEQVVPSSNEDIIRSLLKRYESAAVKGIQERQSGINELKQYAEQMGEAPRKADYSAFLSFVDSLGGGANLAKNYQRPETAEERQQKMLALRQGIGQMQQGITKDQLSLLKEQLDAELGLAKAQQSPFDFRKEMFAQQTREHILKSDQYQKLTAVQELNDKLNTYTSLVKKYGTEFAGPNRQLLDNAKADLDIAYKEAARLGALTGPDMAIIGKALPNVTGFSGLAQKGMMGGADSAVQALNQARQAMARSAQIQAQALQKGFPGYEDVYAPALMSIGIPNDKMQKEIEEMKALQAKKAGK